MVGIETIQITASSEKCKNQQNILNPPNMRSWKKQAILLNKLLLIQLLTLAFQVRVQSGQSEKPVYLPEFSLQGTDGRFYSNKDFEENDLLAVIFLSNHCKISQLFQNQLIKIAELLRDKKVAIVAVSPNYEQAILPDELAYSDLGDSFEEMKKRAIRMKYNFPYLYDGEKQRLTQTIGVKITPTVYLYDEKRELFYVGRIGNIDSPNKRETSELYLAIMRALHEKDVAFKRTKVFGTSIKTKEHLLLAEQVRKRYADESIKLTHADDRKLEFYLNHKTQKPKLFYVWQATDKNARDNLMKLSFLYKIFRKRGLRLVTVCIAEKKEEKEILEQLEKAQLSSTNFLSHGHHVAPLAKIIPSEIEKVTPYYRLVGSEGNMLLGKQGEISKDRLRFEILRALNENP